MQSLSPEQFARFYGLFSGQLDVSTYKMPDFIGLLKYVVPDLMVIDPSGVMLPFREDGLNDVPGQKYFVTAPLVVEAALVRTKK